MCFDLKPDGAITVTANIYKNIFKNIYICEKSFIV